MSVNQSISLWCPAVYRKRLERALAPLAKHLTVQLHPDTGMVKSLTEALAADPTQLCVVVWPGFADHLADQMTAPGGADAARSVADALAIWQDRAETLVAVFAKVRRRMTLVPAAAVLTAPDATVAALAQRLKLPPVQTSPAGTPTAVPSAEQPSHIALLAAAALQAAPSARQTLHRLEAASLPVNGFSLTHSHSAPGLTESLRIRNEAAEQKAKTDALAEVEVTLSDGTLARRDGAATAHYFYERLAQGVAERAALQADLNVCTTRIAALTEEGRQQAALILRQEASLRQESARRAEMEASRDMLLASTSWRITGPLRRIALAFRRRNRAG